MAAKKKHHGGAEGAAGSGIELDVERWVSWILDTQRKATRCAMRLGVLREYRAGHLPTMRDLAEGLEFYNETFTDVDLNMQPSMDYVPKGDG